MVKFTYYGHSCFLLDDGKYKVLADPFLTGNPLAAIEAGQVECDYILVSHAHGDHLGDAAAIAKRTGAMVLAIPEVLGLCEEQAGEIQGHGMNLGGSVKLPFGKVRMTMAFHSSGVAGGIACGFVIQIGGIGGLAPERRADLARFGLRAVLGGSIATFMTATIAGVLSHFG